jgi:class 3 adenylate cyclase/predicted ATPase
MGESRKTVTIVFSDVAGSTGLGEQLDAEAVRVVMERFFTEARIVLERHGGTVEKFIGDAVMAAFGIPTAHEDDGLRAVRAAAEMRERLEQLNEELLGERGVTLAVRTGINTGEVVAGDHTGGQFYASGDAVNIAARLEQAAEPGEILLGEQTYRLVRDAVAVEVVESLTLKGKSQAVPAYRLLEVIEGAPAFTRRFDTPFVGREEELAKLQSSFERVLAEGTPVLVTVLGPAGIGKTRLAGEFAAKSRSQATVLQGRCLSYGEGITFWPLEEILRSLPERPRDVPDPEFATSTEETFWAYRKLFETLARERPLLLLLEDIHWGESTLLDLIEHVVAWTQDAPIMIICLARLELIDVRPGWGGERIELEPLAPGQAERLVAALASRADPGVRARAVEVAEGNPLFLEQLLVLAAEDGQDLPVPQTIQALLTARLDRLEPEERALLERAAVVGKEFWRAALIALSPPETEVSSLLQRLVRRRLIRPERSNFPGEDAFRFGHILIRDATYRATSKEMRADFHERFANWLEENRGRYEEIVGYHLEQAYRYQEELGLLGEGTQNLARRAGELLSTVGLKARHRADHAAAANLLGRAVGLLAQGDELHLSLLPELSDALLELGRYSEARSVLTEAADGARNVGNRGLEWHALLGQLKLDGLVYPEHTNEEAERTSRAALAAFEELGEARGQAKAGYLIGDALIWQFRNEAAARALEKALAQARLSGDEALEAQCAGNLCHALLFGPTPVAEAIDRIQEMHANASGRVFYYERVLLSNLAYLRAEQGCFDVARESLAQAKALAEAFGSEVDVAAMAGFYGAKVERFAGNLERAEAELRLAYEILERLGEKGTRSMFAAHLADVLVDQGRLEEAEDFLRISDGMAARDNLHSRVPLRLVRARIKGQRGNADDAERLVHEALSLLEGTDDLNARGDVLLNLGSVLSMAGKTAEGMSAVEESLRLFDKKGNVVTAQRARARLAAIHAGSPV